MGWGFSKKPGLARWLLVAFSRVRGRSIPLPRKAHQRPPGKHTAFGWTCRTEITEFNERSIRNWPIQATGADILRIGCILAARHDIKLLAPVHDAVLIEAPIERIEADVAVMREIMRRASRIALNADPRGTHELRTDYTIVRYPDRYSDKRGAQVWSKVLHLLAEHHQTVRAQVAHG